ncbi:MAG: hypothetical protein NTU47_06360 [Ignavibacteriales bacterium]|nr:hypothetical protein [Ignavibacteriales bacterium]
MDSTGTTPQHPSIAMIGWTTVIASAVMIVIDVLSLLSSTMLDTLDLSGSMPLLSQYVPDSTKTVVNLFRYSRWWTGYGILFFGFVLVAGLQFLRLRAWGRKALEIACWVGMFNAVVDTLLSYLIWQNMQETLSMALRGLGGGQYSYLNPLGLFTIVLGFLLWIVPSLAMIVYLRRPIIRQTVSLQ